MRIGSRVGLNFFGNRCIDAASRAPMTYPLPSFTYDKPGDRTGDRRSQFLSLGYDNPSESAQRSMRF